MIDRVPHPGAQPWRAVGQTQIFQAENLSTEADLPRNGGAFGPIHGRRPARPRLVEGCRAPRLRFLPGQAALDPGTRLVETELAGREHVLEPDDRHAGGQAEGLAHLSRAERPRDLLVGGDQSASRAGRDGAAARRVLRCAVAPRQGAESLARCVLGADLEQAAARLLHRGGRRVGGQR